MEPPVKRECVETIQVWAINSRYRYRYHQIVGTGTGTIQLPPTNCVGKLLANDMYRCRYMTCRPTHCRELQQQTHLNLTLTKRLKCIARLSEIELLGVLNVRGQHSNEHANSKQSPGPQQETFLTSELQQLVVGRRAHPLQPQRSKLLPHLTSEFLSRPPTTKGMINNGLMKVE